MHGASVSLQQGIEASCVILQNPKSHGSQERVRVGLSQTLIPTFTITAQDLLNRIINVVNLFYSIFLYKLFNDSVFTAHVTQALNEIISRVN